MDKDVIQLPVPRAQSRPIMVGSPDASGVLPVDQLDHVGRLVYSAALGIKAAVDTGDGTGKPTSVGAWLSGVIVAVGLALTASVSMLGYTVAGLREDIEDLQTYTQTYGPRLTNIESDLNETRDAVRDVRDANRRDSRWNQKTTSEMWKQVFPERPIPDVPDSDEVDRSVSSLR